MLETYKTFADALQEAVTKIEAVNDPQAANLKNRILFPIKQEIASLTSQSVNGLISSSSPDYMNQPLKSILGKKISVNKRPLTPKEQDKNRAIKSSIAGDVEKTELANDIRKKRDELYPKFLETANEDLLLTTDANVLRAIGKLVGLPVTSSSPEKLDNSYIDSVKEAIKKVNESNNKQ